MTSYQQKPRLVTTNETRTSDGILIHGPEDFEPMRVAGRLAAETLDFIAPHVVPGVLTEDLDDLCAEFIHDRGGVSAPLGYRGFPKSVCISINHVVCHGIPGDKRVQNGDIINIDVTPTVDGWHGDSSRMFIAGETSKKAGFVITQTFFKKLKIYKEILCTWLKHVFDFSCYLPSFACGR